MGAEKKGGYLRTTLRLAQRRDLAAFGLAFLALAVLLFLSISHQAVFIAYAVASIFVFSSYLMLWLENDREARAPAPGKWPAVSVIIPSFNTKSTIFSCIRACRRMEYPGKKEIIVVDDCSTDGSYGMLQKEPGIRLFRKEKNSGKAAALNFGLRHARGEIVACIDSDTYPAKNTMREAVRHFSEGKNVASVIVFIQVEAPKNLLQRIQELEYWISFGFFCRTIARVDSLYVTPGPTAFYRRGVLLALGGYDERNLSEDLEIALRLQKKGYRIAATHETFVKTEVPSTLGQLYRQRIRWYRGGVANMIMYADLFFNPRYGQFGLFVLPTMLGSGFFAALFMAWALMFWANSALLWLAPFAYDLYAGASLAAGGLALGISVLSSAWILWAFSLALWSYFLMKSFELAGEEFRARHVLPLLCMVFIYPLFIGLVFLISYLSELFGTRYSW